MKIASPHSAVASRVAETKSQARSPAAPRIASSMRRLDRSRSGLVANSEVGATWLFTIAAVRPAEIFARFSAPVVTTMSQPITRSAAPAAIRVAAIASGRAATRTWLVTGPFFCARPVTSSTEQPLPSRWAAMPSSAPTVITPEPPMPVTSTFQGRSRSGGGGLGQRGEARVVAADALGFDLAQPAALDRDEARAVALEARVVLVAARLVDPPLAPELGLDRLDRDAVRLHAAVAAALAHELVDHDAPVGIRELAALAQPARLGRAGLVVDQRRHAGHVAQLALHAVELVAVVDRDAGRNRRRRRTSRARSTRSRSGARPRRRAGARSRAP